MQRLPDFLVIGAAKCGTTSLASYLDAHDQISMARPKELRFFSHNWDRGLDWYASRFERVPSGHLAGEASPQYTQAPLIDSVPERIAAVMPNVKLIYLVRDPFDQMRSFYRHLVFKGREQARTLDQALRENPIYLMTASFGFQVSRYLEWFPPGQVRIVNSEDLMHNRRETLDDVLGFLKLEGRIPDNRLDAELNRSADKDFLPSYLDFPRSVWRAGRRFTGRVPRGWRHSIRKSLGKPPPTSAFQLSATTRAWLKAMLESDVETLKRHAGGRLDEVVPVWLERVNSDD